MIRKMARPFEVKAIETKGPGTFEGYGSVFGVKDSYGDIVEPGAFADSIASWRARGKLPPMLWQHKASEPIGVYTEMREDSRGLYVEGRLLVEDDPLAKRALAHIKAGSIGGLSIGFMVGAEGERYDKATGINHLTKLDLWEVSPVTFPANIEAGFDGVRSADGVLGAREIERALRGAGFSIAQAKALMAGGYKALREGVAEAVNEAAPREAGDRDVLEALQRLERMVAGRAQ